MCFFLLLSHYSFYQKFYLGASFKAHDWAEQASKAQPVRPHLIYPTCLQDAVLNATLDAFIGALFP
jgi:hypothetical protein